MVCLIDPIGDVYACPFAIHENFLAGNVTGPGGFTTVWRESELFTRTAGTTERRGVRIVRSLRLLPRWVHGGEVFTGLPLDGPDPECVQGFGESLLAGERRTPPRTRTTPAGCPSPS